MCWKYRKKNTIEIFVKTGNDVSCEAFLLRIEIPPAYITSFRPKLGLDIMRKQNSLFMIPFLVGTLLPLRPVFRFIMTYNTLILPVGSYGHETLKGRLGSFRIFRREGAANNT